VLDYAGDRADEMLNPENEPLASLFNSSAFGCKEFQHLGSRAFVTCCALIDLQRKSLCKSNAMIYGTGIAL
jgi:hypothetical protein